MMWAHRRSAICLLMLGAAFAAGAQQPTGLSGLLQRLTKTSDATTHDGSANSAQDGGACPTSGFDGYRVSLVSPDFGAPTQAGAVVGPKDIEGIFELMRTNDFAAESRYRDQLFYGVGTIDKVERPTYDVRPVVHVVVNFGHSTLACVTSSRNEKMTNYGAMNGAACGKDVSNLRPGQRVAVSGKLMLAKLAGTVAVQIGGEHADCAWAGLEGTAEAAAPSHVAGHKVDFTFTADKYGEERGNMLAFRQKYDGRSVMVTGLKVGGISEKSVVLVDARFAFTGRIECLLSPAGRRSAATLRAGQWASAVGVPDFGTQKGALTVNGALSNCDVVSE